MNVFDGRKQLYPIAMSARLDPGLSAKRARRA
jgi:hypothetical protein